MQHLKSVTLQTDSFPTKEYYPFNLAVLQRTRRIQFGTPITLFVGENGTGKSTLLEALAKASGIHIWREPTTVPYHFNPYRRRLHLYLQVEWEQGMVAGSFFGAEYFRYFSESLDEWAIGDPSQFDYFGGKSLAAQSHGQSLMAYFRNRYQIKGLYLLDEPETALSPRSQLELLKVLGKMSDAGHAQFIIATHSPILLACTQATILSFDHIPVQALSYEQTEHYKIFKDFVQDRSKYL